MGVGRGSTCTALRDKCLADYEARLRQEVSGRLALLAGLAPSALRGTGHACVAYSGTDDRPVSPWARYQECTHRLTAHMQQLSHCGRYLGKVTAYADWGTRAAVLSNLG